MSESPDNGDDKMIGPDDICRDFLRNVCKRGKRCKFRHPDPGEARELGKRQEYTFCHDFQNSGCRRANCRFIHCTREEEEYYKQMGQLPVRLQQAAALGIGVVPSGTEMPLLRGEVPICKDFLKGECKRANRCKYRHISNNGEYGDYENRGNDNMIRSASEMYDPYDEYDSRYDSTPKRRKIELEEIENNPYNTHSNFNNNQNVDNNYRYLPRTPMEFRMLEEENTMLRRKVEELKKQVSDLAATNEVLLEQNARYRASKVSAVTVPPIVTVSQVVTPTITRAPGTLTARSLTIHENTELLVGQTIPAQLAAELTTAAINNAALNNPALNNPALNNPALNNPALNNAISTTPVTLGQQIVPVSMMESIAAAGGVANHGGVAGGVASQAASGSMATPLPQTNLPPPNMSIAQSSLCQTNLPPPNMSIAQSSLCQTIMSGPSNAMVSYPIMSHTQHPNSSLG